MASSFFFSIVSMIIAVLFSLQNKASQGDYLSIQEKTDHISMPTDTNEYFTIEGKISTGYGGLIQNVKVIAYFSDETQDTIVTEEDGSYRFMVAKGTNVTIKPEKDFNYNNGLDIADILTIRGHILRVKEIEKPYNLIAADVNNNGMVDVNDMITLMKLQFQKISKLPSNTSWRFFDAINDESEITIQNVSSNHSVDFLGVKIGDVTQNVNLER